MTSCFLVGLRSNFNVNFDSIHHVGENPVELSSARFALLYVFSGKSSVENPMIRWFSRLSQIHLPASLLLDCQSLYPPSLIPSFMSQLPKMYIQLSADPLVGGAMGYTSANGDLTWFKTFLLLEA